MVQDGLESVTLAQLYPTTHVRPLDFCTAFGGESHSVNSANFHPQTYAQWRAVSTVVAQ